MSELASDRIQCTSGMVRSGIIPARSWGPLADLLSMIADDVRTYERLGGYPVPAAEASYGSQAALIATATLGYEAPGAAE